MIELYKGKAGSSITYLASDISASQTTISIADDGALPDAPNIATIGMGENIETIKYEIKSNGVLQEVVRGIEGIPQAWHAGTEVARFFTAYDHNAILNTVGSLLTDFNSYREVGATWRRVDRLSGIIQITSTDYTNPTQIPLSEAYLETNVYAVDFATSYSDNRQSQIVLFRGFNGASAGILLITGTASRTYSVNKIRANKANAIGFYGADGINNSSAELYVRAVYVVKEGVDY